MAGCLTLCVFCKAWGPLFSCCVIPPALSVAEGTAADRSSLPRRLVARPLVLSSRPEQRRLLPLRSGGIAALFLREEMASGQRSIRAYCARCVQERAAFNFAVNYCSGILAKDACAQSNHPNSGRPARLLQMSPAKSRANGEPCIVLPVRQQIR